MEDSQLPPRFIDHPYEILDNPVSQNLPNFETLISQLLDQSKSSFFIKYYRASNLGREEQARQHVCGNFSRKEDARPLYLFGYRRPGLHVL